MNQDLIDFQNTMMSEWQSARQETAKTHDLIKVVQREISDLSDRIGDCSTSQQVCKLKDKLSVIESSTLRLGGNTHEVEKKLKAIQNFLTKYTWHSIPRETDRKSRDRYYELESGVDETLM